jgi:pullulanase
MAIQPNSHLTPHFAYFSDTVRDLLRGSVWEDAELGFVSGKPGLEPLLAKCMKGMPDWCKNPTQSVNYASCHDNMTLIDRIAISTPRASYRERIRMNKLAAAVYMLCQGIPFIHAGEELLRSKGFDHNSYRSPDSVNAIRWNDLNKPEVQDTLAYYKGLIALRKAFSVLRLTDPEKVNATVSHIGTAAFHLKGQQELFILFNPSRETRSIPLPSGNWQVLVQDDIAGATPLQAVMDLAAAPISTTVVVKV